MIKDSVLVIRCDGIRKRKAAATIEPNLLKDEQDSKERKKRDLIMMHRASFAS